jgi:hypothetical protein
MAAPPHAITTAAKAFKARAGNIAHAPAAGFLAALAEAVEEFNLAPDIWVDVKRLPATVQDLPTLIAYLRTIKAELSDPTDETKTSGRLRLYKLFVCCIHGLHAFLVQRPAPAHGVAPAAFAAAASAHAGANPPQGLSPKGVALWTATFRGNPPRTMSCLLVLIMFMETASAPAPAGGGGAGAP